MYRDFSQTDQNADQKSRFEAQRELLYQKKAQNYLLRYIRELQIHFNLSDEATSKILAKVRSTVKPKSSIQNWFNMLNLRDVLQKIRASR
jgi:hypothetical protein